MAIPPLSNQDLEHAASVRDFVFAGGWRSCFDDASFSVCVFGGSSLVDTRWRWWGMVGLGLGGMNRLCTASTEGRTPRTSKSRSASCSRCSSGSRRGILSFRSCSMMSVSIGFSLAPRHKAALGHLILTCCRARCRTRTSSLLGRIRRRSRSREIGACILRITLFSVSLLL